MSSRRLSISLSLAACVALASPSALAQRGRRPEVAARAACFNAEAIRAEDDQRETSNREQLQRALGIVDGAITQLGNGTSAAVQDTRVFCLNVRAGILEQQNQLANAWTAVEQSWSVALPLRAQRNQPSPRQAVESTAFAVGRARWSGASCADGVRETDLPAAETAAMRVMMRGSSPGQAQCLAAIRTRMTRANVGYCRALSALPNGVPAVGSGREWIAIDPQTQLYTDGASVLVARISGNSGRDARGARYVRCGDDGAVASTTASGRWVIANAMIVVIKETIPCGEDGPGPQCTPERRALVFDANLALRGDFVMRRSAAEDAGPVAMPAGELDGLASITADGASNVRIGTRVYTVRDGALVPTN